MISILLPFRDAQATIGAALESIVAQTFGDFELLAIDDGSTDESAEVVTALAARDRRIRLLQPGRVGLVHALNLAICESRAPLVARMDADDLMHRERLELQLDFMREHPLVDVVGTQVTLFPDADILAGYREYVRWQNSCVTPEEIADNIYVESPFAHPSVMIRRSALDRVGMYREGDFPEDYELWLRMHAAGCRMAKVPRVLLEWREHPDRMSRRDRRYSRDAFDRLRAEYLAQDSRLRCGRPVAFWGAGRRTRPRAQLLVERGVAPLVWIDIDPRKIGKQLHGVSVVPPQWLAREPKPFVLVYVASHGARESIAERLHGAGYRRGEDWLAVG